MLGFSYLRQYNKNRQVFFEISFTSGVIAFDTEFLEKEEIQEFENNIRLAKDAENNQSQTVSTTDNNVADELKKYKDLFEQGAISEEEYNDIKNKLIKKI